MEKMRWFIIGNLVGISILIAGIVAKEYARNGGTSTSFKTESTQSANSPSGAHSQANATTGLSDAPPPHLVQQVATTRDIKKGSEVLAGDIALKQVDQKHAPPHGIVKLEDAVGKHAKTDLLEGQIIEPGDLTD